MKALMIEDEEDDHRILVSVCKRYRIPLEIERHKTGEAGLAALLAAQAAGTPPGLVVLDVDLPRLTGIEVLTSIRADARLRALTVMVITGSLAPEDRAACHAADYFYYKPRSLDGWINIVLLLRKLTETGDEARETPAPDRATPAHLLHIDDERDDRELFARAFAQSALPAALHQVASIAEALLFLNRLHPYQQAPRPGLVVLDLGLPGVDGRELLQTIRANPRFRDLPVIVLTGSQRYDDIERCRDLLVEDYVVKPQTSHELHEFILSLRRWLTSPDGTITASPTDP